MLRSLPSVVQHARQADAPDVGDAELAPFAALAPPRSLCWLDFDIENRPLSYWYDGNCTAEITAIAWSVIGDPNGQIICQTLARRGGAKRMLAEFVKAYNGADGVTGHYVRRHDLPIINGALVEHGMAPLGPKLVSDTRTDLKRWKDLPASQEALGAMLGLSAPKEHMSQADWRDANRLTPNGIVGTRRRVIGDVAQHMELRAALLERGLLKAPRMWRP